MSRQHNVGKTFDIELILRNCGRIRRRSNGRCQNDINEKVTEL